MSYDFPVISVCSRFIVYLTAQLYVSEAACAAVFMLNEVPNLVHPLDRAIIGHWATVTELFCASLHIDNFVTENNV